MSLPEILRRPLALPVVASPMFILSGPELVIAQCTCRRDRLVPRAQRAARRACWMTGCTASSRRTATFALQNPDQPVAPFAVNQIVHKSQRPPRADVRSCVEHQVPIVITSLGARPDINDADPLLRRHRAARRDQRHVRPQGRSRRAPTASSPSRPARAATPAPRRRSRCCRRSASGSTGRSLLSGSIAHGASILAAQAAGADLAYVGSAFMSTDEANNDDGYKQMIVDSTAPTTSSTATCSPASTATTCAAASRPPGWTRRTCRCPTRRPWTSARAAAATPRPGATSGARARASARSAGARAWPSWSSSCAPSTTRR